MFHGRFVWYELMATDKPAAEAFYPAVVGWGTQPAGPDHPDYTLLTAGAVPVAGLMALPPAAAAAGVRPGWLGYVAVEDVDAWASQAAAAGGAVRRGPADIPGVGRFAVITDPQGAEIVLFRGSESAPPPVLPEPGYAGWRELISTDHEAGFAFYASLFGWTRAEALDMGPMGTYQLFAAGGETIGGMMTNPATEGGPTWRYYFQVNAISAAIARLESAGGSVVNGPHQVPGGQWIVHALDPQGLFLALVSAAA
jgi:predicted enzyme related to lactoylglutathione lyase